jgi:hypothetical protein
VRDFSRPSANVYKHHNGNMDLSCNFCIRLYFVIGTENLETEMYFYTRVANSFQIDANLKIFLNGLRGSKIFNRVFENSEFTHIRLPFSGLGQCFSNVFRYASGIYVKPQVYVRAQIFALLVVRYFVVGTYYGI